MLHRLTFAALFVFAVLTSVARAESPMVYSSNGAAISGYDPVAYFTMGRAVPGRVEFTLVWKRAKWRFVSADNLALFESNPRAYAPQYGGYCAYGVSRGGLSATDPEAWLIHDGRLYLVHNQSVQQRFSGNVSHHVIAADTHWPDVLRD